MTKSGAKAERLSVNISSPLRSEQLSLINGSPVEEQYANNISIEWRKRFGQFFTPEPIAALMTEWIEEIEPKTILDPAVGTGVFVRSTSRFISNNFEIDCYDLDEVVASYIDRTIIGTNKLSVFNSDFLTTKIDKLYDAVIMNPPYLRHHDMRYEFDIHSFIGKLAQHEISKLSNAYVLFVIKACSLLRAGGRGAFIIPTEWTNANFGQQFKEYLIKYGGLKAVVYFSNCSDIFPDALTTACVLFIEKTDTPADYIEVIYAEGVTKYSLPRSMTSLRSTCPVKQIAADTLRGSAKWDYLIKSGEATKNAGFVRLGELATSKRGIATGANDFFHLPLSEATKIGIDPRHLIPCIGRANDVRGLVFDEADYSVLLRSSKRSQLISFDDDLTEPEQKYIHSGYAANFHTRFLLSRRKPWYFMESRKTAPIWAAVFGRKELRFIYNQAMVANLTTFHGIYPFNDSPEFARALSVVLNSPEIQQAARAHIRVYGGGLLKFEPKDLLEIQVPDLSRCNSHIVAALSACLRHDHAAIEWNNVNQLVSLAAKSALQSSSTFPPTGLT